MAELNHLDNIIYIQSGVGDKKGKGELDKTLHPGGWKLQTNDNGTIKINTIDNLCKNMNISMMHIDVEGMEYQTLVG